MANKKAVSDVRSYENGRFVEAGYLNGPINDIKDIISPTKLTSSDNIRELNPGAYYWTSSAPRFSPDSILLNCTCLVLQGESATKNIIIMNDNDYWVGTVSSGGFFQGWEKLNNQPETKYFQRVRVVTNSRTHNVTYRNNQSVPIIVIISTQDNTDNFHRFYIDGEYIAGGSTESGSESASFTCSFIVPPGSTYSTNRETIAWTEIY